MRRQQRALLANVPYHYAACTLPQRSINCALLYAEQYYLFFRQMPEYSRFDPEHTILPSSFMFRQTITIRDNQERTNVYCDMFGWHENKRIRRRADIRTCKPEWMHMIYKINAVLLQACTTGKGADEKSDRSSFMTFNPYVKDGVIERYKT